MPDPPSSPSSGKILGLSKPVFFAVLAAGLLVAYYFYKRSENAQAASTPSATDVLSYSGDTSGLTAADIGGTSDSSGTRLPDSFPARPTLLPVHDAREPSPVSETARPTTSEVDLEDRVFTTDGTEPQGSSDEASAPAREVAVASGRRPERRRVFVRVGALLLVLVGCAAVVFVLPGSETRAGRARNAAPKRVILRTAGPAAEPRRTNLQESPAARSEKSQMDPRSIRRRSTPHTSRSRHAATKAAAPRAAEHPPTFVWAPQAGAIGYEVQFFKGQNRILVRRTSKPRLSLPPHWVYEGRRVELTAGHYRWYVWPIRPSKGPAQPEAKQPKAIYASTWIWP